MYCEQNESDINLMREVRNQVMKEHETLSPVKHTHTVVVVVVFFIYSGSVLVCTIVERKHVRRVHAMGVKCENRFEIYVSVFHLILTTWLFNIFY